MKYEISTILEDIKANCLNIDDVSTRIYKYRLISILDGYDDDEICELLNKVADYVRTKYNTEQIGDDPLALQIFDDNDEEIIAIDIYTAFGELWIEQD